ncbi:MAG: LolA family protein [Planctomycetota bacterium]
MKQLLAAVMSLGLATGAAAQGVICDKETGAEQASLAIPADLTDADEVLKWADRALKRVKLVRYRISFKGTGFMTQRAPAVLGTVITSGKHPHRPEKYRLDVSVRSVGRGDYTDIIVGSDGKLHYLIDRQSKTAHVSTDPKVTGAKGKDALFSLVPHFTHPNALYDEMRMDLTSLIGSATEGGVECYEIQLQNSGQLGDTIWMFGKEDLLPRSRQAFAVNPSLKEGALEWHLSELQVDPKFDKDPFKFVLPEGYTKTDQRPGR